MPAGTGRRHRTVPAKCLQDLLLRQRVRAAFRRLLRKTRSKVRFAAVFYRRIRFFVGEGQKGYRIVSTLTADYRHATRRKNAKTRVSKKHISESLAASLRELFRLLIRQIEKPAPDEARWGSTYFFASTDNEGETTVGET